MGKIGEEANGVLTVIITKYENPSVDKTKGFSIIFS